MKRKAPTKRTSGSKTERKKKAKKVTSKGQEPQSQEVLLLVVCTSMQYPYMKIEDILEEEGDRLNLYGVVLDSSAPHYVEKTGKYIAIMKLIDGTVNPASSSKKEDYLTAVFLADAEHLVPCVTQVGNIVRVHRGRTKKAKGTHELSCAVNGVGAWTVFDLNGSTKAVSQSGKTYTFTQNDKEELSEIRKFAKNFFKKHELDKMSLSEGAKKKPDDFDTLCVVLESVKGKARSLTLCDEQKVVKLEIPKGREVPRLEEMGVVKIVSAEYKDKATLTMNEYTNVMKVPDDFMSAKEIVKEVKGKGAAKEIKKKIKEVSKQTSH
eukprot:TRINITY_DN136884_c0_g1_i1.p1 TRINITY_DN136884_c0_g1~~TRINITY_DN136884_c0_g1_i1.p1  ORF type:complete len:322 (+),score=51.61 TRINITY_DN136884_c0_g1_i1:165-1130(+)